MPRRKGRNDAPTAPLLTIRCLACTSFRVRWRVSDEQPSGTSDPHRTKPNLPIVVTVLSPPGIPTVAHSSVVFQWTVCPVGRDRIMLVTVLSPMGIPTVVNPHRCQPVAPLVLLAYTGPNFIPLGGHSFPSIASVRDVVSVSVHFPHPARCLSLTAGCSGGRFPIKPWYVESSSPLRCLPN